SARHPALAPAARAPEPPRAPPPAPASESTAAARVDAPPKSWDTMTRSERFQYMTDHVEPAMAAKFQAFDPQRFATFNCETCHGDDMVERQFAMPNPNLKVL